VIILDIFRIFWKIFTHFFENIYKNFLAKYAYKKYVYQYMAESRNGVVGTANLRNGPKVSCQVEIEVPQICRFIMHTRGCVLSEVSIMDPQGQPVYKQSPGSEAFQAAMEKNALKFSVEEVTNVELYPENDEPVNILNIKRGIISALMVPILEDGQSSFMSTVHGHCLTDYVENARKDIATEVTLSRDLSQCDQFYSRDLSNSPLALLQKLHSPMSKLITSTQKCNYQFDNRGRHITTAMCTEQHIYLPFSHVDNGISSVLTQDLSFQSSKRINNRIFDVNPSQSTPLHFEDPEDKAPVQTKDAVLSTFRDLAALPGTDQGQKRTSLFHKLVSGLRVLRNETLSQTVPEMREISGWLTWQALIQCGTPECTSAILQVIRTIDGVSLEVDALVYGLSLQANPDAARVRDMLSMAQYKQSKAIMYALANTVKKFHEGAVTPVVTDVSKFMETLLNDCSLEIQDYDSEFPPDPAETSFLVLRKTDIPLSNQKAAIRAFRLMDINDEIRNVLMEVYQDTQSPVEKRLAAYLILMKTPDYTLVRNVVNSLENERNEQLRSFVISHLNNIRNSDEPQILREYIDLALKDELSPPNKVFDGMSRNYKINSPLGSIQSNMIFDDRDTLPKEMMLETTLKAFDYNYDIFEVGVEGTGFEPTIDALFGEKGFFPESISRALYMAGDTAQMLRDVLDRTAPQQDRKKRQVKRFLDTLYMTVYEYNLRLMNDLRFSPTPEATAYLRLLGNEIGYMKTTEMRKLAETLFMYFHIFIRILPGSAFNALMSSTENEVFAHYIFMENAFALPTASGFPLKFSLAGVFAPGAKGGLVPSTDLSFMPSVGLEFITQMGVHIPDYVDAGIEMHTNMYHESSLNAKVSINKNQIKLSIPAPTSNTQLFSIRSVSPLSDDVKLPSLVEDRTDSTNCQPLFTGLNLCTTWRYSNATSMDQAPYYPLTGETKFAMEIQPTGKVSEYTATITDETLREGKKGRHKVETLKLTLRAEGEDSVEATAALKYNRNKNTLSTDVVIPDYDVEAGIKLAVTNGDTDGTKMRGITIDVTNKNIPQLTLVGRTRLDMMRDAMLQLEMGIPSLKTDASVTANLKKDEDVLLDLETVIRLPETTYQHKTSLKYDNDKFEVEVKTDLNSDVQKMIPNLEDHHRKFQQLIDEILDQRVTKTDMKLRHIVTKGIEAGNIWLDKLTASMPYLANLRSKRSVSDLTLPSLPDKLFLQSESLFRYQFNKDRLAISVPLPHGGKKSEELNFPKTLSTPVIDLPEIGLYIPANNYPLPSFIIPPSLDFTVPLLGLAEASTKVSSNFYSWEGSISGGNNTVDVPSYVAQYKAIGQSPFNLLSYKLEGAAMMSGRADDNLKYLLNSSFSHVLVDTSLSVLETLRVSNKLNARANYKFEASSPVGLQASLYYSAQSTSTLDSDEVSGDGTVDGLFKIGSFYTNTSYTQSYNLRPRDQEGRGESTLLFDSPILKFQNMIRGVYANSELNIVSKTSAQKDIFKHIAELKYKDAQLILKCNAVATPMGKSLNNKVELGVSSQMALVRIESQADDDTKRAYSLITGSLDSNGLELNSEGSFIFDTGRGLHKATVRIGRSGLTTSGTNSIQCSPVTLENFFSAEASMYGDLTGHAYDAQMKTENSHTLTLTLWTVKLHSNTNNFICEDIYYKQDTKVDMKPFVLAFDMTNDLRFYDVSLNNEGHIKLEPIKVDLSGSTTGAYGEQHNVKHAYELTYDNMAGTLKCSTSGNVMEAQLSHNCELEVAGLSSTSNCEARINSEPLRFDGTIRTMALPFSLTIDALVNSDGEINLHGKHTGQLYSKLLVKAEPLALAYSHDSRVSTTHKPRRREFSTNLDNKCEGVLTPNEQYLTWNVKSKLNDHTYNQAISTYNHPEKAGFEFSGVMSTDVFSRYKRSVPETQEFRMTGFIKYDKNSDCHIIEIPFIESFPAAFEKLKNTLAQALESLQQFIRNLDINQLITDFRAKLDEIPVQVSDFMREMDLENKVDQVKVKLDYLFNEFAVTMDDLELAMNNFRDNLEYTVTDIATKIKDLILKIEEYVNSGQLADNITNVLSHIGNRVQSFDEKYNIKQSFVKVLDVIEDIIRQINLQKLKDSSAAFLREVDSKYGILETIKEKLSDLKQAIDNFDINVFLQDVKGYLLSIDWVAYLEQLSYKIPSSQIKKVLESMNDVIVNWIDEYEIPDKLNAVYSDFKDLLLKYDLDDIFKDLMDQAVTLVKEFKIEETVQTGVETLKSIKFEFVYDKVMQFLHSLTSQLKATDFKKSIDDLNEHISSMLKSMKEFDYDAFVDETNKKIAELTEYINEQIKTYEIVEKIEAVRDFFREIQSSIFTYLDELKNTKVADALKKLKRVIDTTFYNDIKLKALDMLEDMKQRISDMDVRDEIYIYLQRASESYRNIVAYISTQFDRLMEKIQEVAKSNDVINQIKQAVDGLLKRLKSAEIEVPTFTVPLTDLVIPAFTINLNKLQDISIPSQISLPEFTILNSYTVPAIIIDFDEIKARIVAVIDDMKEFEIQTPDPEDIFGDLKVLYLSELPDLTFPEITLSEIKFPAINIPKLSLNNFEITMLPIPEIKSPGVPSDVCIPVFGKLHGEFKINAPQYSLETTWKLENSTTTLKSPQFTGTITSHAKSPIEPLEYTFEATAQLEAPRMKKLLFTETMKANHIAFSIDHEGSLTLTGSSAEASAKTTTKATTPMYTAELISIMAFTLRNGIYASIDTTYNHNLDIPSIETSSQASMQQIIAATMESGKISVNSETIGNGKWSIQDYSDEGTHKSNAEFNIDFNTAKLTFAGETDCKALKAKQTLTAESVILSHITAEARCEAEVPSVKKSVMVVNGEAHFGDLKVALTASHDAEFTGNLIGSMSNSLEFMTHPFEIVLDVKNKLNSKIFFPLKLTGKVDLQHDYGVVLNSEKQRACWFALARFNQYKYGHNFTAENNEMDIFLLSSASGEANLDFLTVPLSVPQINIPYFEMQTPEVRDFSLWENVGLKTLLTTPQQSFDMNLKLQYHKNPDTHKFELYLEPIYTMGNITCDFSFKSPLITISTNAGLYNQFDIVARFSTSSSSVFDILNVKIDGTTSLTKKRGLKLATTVSLEHNNIEANHECAVSLNKRSMEASVANNAKISLPFLSLELNHELTGNTKTKPNVSSKKKVKYTLNIPLIESVGKGNLEMIWDLEALSSDVSLETSTKGKSDITVMDIWNFAGDLENGATFYLNANGLRTTVTTALNSNINKQAKQKRSSNNVFMFYLKKNLALEVSLRRMFATIDYTSTNNVDFAPISTNGKQNFKGELDFVPLTTLKTTLNIDASQPSSLGDVEVTQSIKLAISSEKQSFTWNGKEQLASLIHVCDLLMSNDESEVRMDLTGSVEGHLAFLRSFIFSYFSSATATIRYDNGVINLNGKCNLIHNDVNVKWQHVLAQNLREPRHTLNVDIISQTFVDGNFRFASRKDGITASMSSPSSGFLGLQFQRRSPTQLYGKLFSRYLSSPEKDTDVLTAKASLKNSDKLVFQMSWNWEFLHDVIEGTKYRIPAMTDAVLKFINKYHTYHFGFNIQRAGMKMKNTVSNVIERGYHEVPMSFDTLQDLVHSLADQGKDMYRKASDGLMSMNVQDAIDRLVHEAREMIKLIEDKMNALLDEITQFLRDRDHSVPEWKRLSIPEIFQEAQVEFTLPRTDVVVNGNEVMDKLKSVYNELRHPMSRELSVIHNRVAHLFQVIIKKAEDFITYLKDKNVDISSEIHAIHAKIVQSSKQHTEERVYTDTEALISNLQIHLYGGLHEGVDLMRRASQSTAPYITVSNKKADIEIPLPFLWKSFSDWPKQFGQ
uniref:Vitellogenin domain-containing protein n=1 Tax=Amphiprion ocellaris TaxID=80972 RepID=A0A3Q1CD90_AMPOC